MDWKQDLRIDDANKHTIYEIYKNPSIKELPEKHFDSEDNYLSICYKYKYWSWLLKIADYKI